MNRSTRITKKDVVLPTITKMDNETFAWTVYHEALGKQTESNVYAFLVGSLMRWYTALVACVKTELVKIEKTKIQFEKSKTGTNNAKVDAEKEIAIAEIRQGILKIEKRMSELKPRLLELQEEQKRQTEGHLALKYKALLIEAQGLIPWEEEAMGWHTRAASLLRQVIPGETSTPEVDDLSGLF